MKRFRLLPLSFHVSLLCLGCITVFALLLTILSAPGIPSLVNPDSDHVLQQGFKAETAQHGSQDKTAHCTGDKCNESKESNRLISCRELIQGSEEMMVKAERFMNQNPPNHPSDTAVIHAASSCKMFQLAMGYPSSPGSHEEEAFPIAYSIVVHQGAWQVQRLLRAIYQPQNYYCIHVDRKSSQLFLAALEKITRCFPNVFLASQRENVVWAGYSRLKADLNCISDLVNRSITWKYLINLTGQEFPMKTNRELVHILNTYKGANEVQILPKKAVSGNFHSLLSKRYHIAYADDGSQYMEAIEGVKKESPPHRLTLVKGSAFCVFSRAFMEYVLSDERVKDFLDWCKDAWSPDEIFWATLNAGRLNKKLAAPGRYSGKLNTKPWLAKHVVWVGDPCHGKFVRHICIFGIRDLPDLVNRTELFANKFYQDYQFLTYDCLEEWFRNRSRLEVGKKTFDQHKNR